MQRGGLRYPTHETRTTDVYTPVGRHASQWQHPPHSQNGTPKPSRRHTDWDNKTQEQGGRAGHKNLEAKWSNARARDPGANKAKQNAIYT